MAINRTIGRSILALALVAAPAAAAMTGFATIAHAKGGEGHGGGGNGGRGNDGGHGNGHGGHGGKSSDKAGERGKSSHKSSKTKTDDAKKTKTVRTDAERAPALRSLNRNYHAYLNSKDPRMAAVAAYAIAYARFEVENGVDEIPADAELGDDALRDALAGFTKNGVVTDAMLDEAKSVLGVGTEVGKIDQIRETLESEEADPDTAE